MTADLVRRIENRRRIIASLRESAAGHEIEATLLRNMADGMEVVTDHLEAQTSPAPAGAAPHPATEEREGTDV